jgi:protein tyrosine/serine phosphatase
LDWDACYNARDVGGYPLAGGGQTRWGRLVRADNLRRLSARGRAALLASGVRTVIDLRSPSELGIDPYPFPPPGAAGATPGAPAYRNLPVLDPAAAAEAAAVGEATTVEAMYAAVLAHGHARLGAILRAVATAPAGGVLVYCHGGKDRTGVVTALVLAVAGVPAADIAADYAVSDRYLQPWYEEQLRRAPDAPTRRRLARSLRSALNAAAPETMLATLAHLDRRYGGPEAYCSAAGLTDAELGALRGRLATGQ